LKAACSDDEFVRLWKEHQSPIAVARALKINVRNVHARRNAIEAKRGIKMNSAPVQVTFPENGVRTTIDNLENGVILVASDCHYWPGLVSTAHRALVTATRELKPYAVIINGDAFDGAAPGRHGRIMWEKKPSVKQELEAVSDRLGEIEAVAGNARLLWNWGNHDQRFDSKLSAMVPEFEGVPGFSLKDHFPRWRFSMSILVNDSVMIKHRLANGLHAAYNNTLRSGVSMVTGHLHSLKVTPWTDYIGTRYGVDTGTLAATTGPQFSYSEDAPSNHRSGFAVLTIRGGKLMPPELLEVVDEDEGLVFFRGQLVKV
jgi:hypothetical protein